MMAMMWLIEKHVTIEENINLGLKLIKEKYGTVPIRLEFNPIHKGTFKSDMTIKYDGFVQKLLIYFVLQEA